MKHPLYSHVVLLEDFPAEGLRRGDLATIVEHYPPGDDREPGYELEVFNAVGETVAVITVRESQVAAPRKEDRLCVRNLALEA